MIQYKLKLQAAFYEEPIIIDDGNDFTHYEAVDLKISDQLKHEIQVWDDEFKDTFDSEYPPDSCFATLELKQAHSEKGHELAEKLQKELGDEYLVEYKI